MATVMNIRSAVIDGLVHDCGKCSALAMELPHSLALCIMCLPVMLILELFS